MNEKVFGKINLVGNEDSEKQDAWLYINEEEIFIETSYNTFKDGFWRILNGSFNGIDNATMINCYAGSGSSGTGGSWRKIKTGSLFKGIKFQSYEELIFKKVEFSVKALSDWLKGEGRISKIDNHTFKTSENTVIYSNKINDIIFTITIGYGYDKKMNESVSIEKNCAIKIESDTGLHIEEISKLLTKLKKFVLFITNKSPKFDNYSLLTIEDDNCELVNIEVPLNEIKFSQNLDIPYRITKENFGDIFYNWMTKKDLIPILDLILERHYNTELSFQGYFLNMCVAIENYSNNLIDVENDEVISKNIQRREAIRDLINDTELKNWFSSKSSHWKLRNFSDKLKIFKDIISYIRNDVFVYTTEEIISKTVKTRNDIAHEGKYENHFSITELLLVGKILEYTIKLEILKYLSLGEKEIEELSKSARNNLDVLARINKYGKYAP
jgi:hypothetical protein